MAEMIFTEGDAKRYYKIEKEIHKDIIIERTQKKLMGTVDVFCPSEETLLQLKIDCSQNLKRIGFILTYRGIFNVRRFCTSRGHRNPDKTEIRGPHKHSWTDQYKDKVAYRVIDIDTSTLKMALTGFLKECNIVHNGRIITQESI